MIEIEDGLKSSDIYKGSVELTLSSPLKNPVNMVSKTLLVILIIATAVVTAGVVAGIMYVTLIHDHDDDVQNVSGCEIYPFETDPHPLIVLSGNSTLPNPIWPERNLRFARGQAVDFICPGRVIYIGETELDTALLTGTCYSDTKFQIGDDIVEWADLICSDYPWRDIRDTGNICATDGRELEAGFIISDGRFIRTLTICFNPTLQIAYYTYINQTSAINQRVLDTPRPSWLQGSGIYTIGTVTNLYLRNNQRATVNGLLSLPSDSQLYIQDTTDSYLARGHMTARSDGYYAAEQNATFFMQNIAPQWQKFNGWNWNQIEIDVRDYASERGVDLQVWTGVYGVTTLPNAETGEPTELYLYVNETHRALPVPEIYWKAVYDPISERGVALIGVNNPYNSTFNKYCFDVSDRLTWLHCDRNNQELGFCYACSITTLRYVVTYIPNVSERGLLL